MTDFAWPDDLAPYVQSFYLQPHTGGSESPFSRKTKTYELSAPRWVCRVSFRGGYHGRTGVEALGPRIDALLAKVKGRRHRILLHDTRRPRMRGLGWAHDVTNEAAAAGATSMVLTGFAPHAEAVVEGDYLGGDGRPHIVLDRVFAGADGKAEVEFEPPLRSAVAAGAAIFGKVPATFKLTSDDAGANPVQVGEAATYDLELVEDL